MGPFFSCPARITSSADSKGVKIWQHPVLKGSMLLIILLGGLGVVYLSPLRDQLRHVHAMRDMIISTSWAAPVVFTLAAALLVSIGCPRLLLCPISGMTFGFIYGLLWAQAGTILGSYMTFLVVRLLGRDLVLNKWPSLNRFSSLFESRGIATVFVVRQMPVGGVYINVLLGLSSVRHRDFLLGTALGILPEAIPATLIGSEAITAGTPRSVFFIITAVSGLVLIWISAAWYLRSSQLPIAEIVRKISGKIKNRNKTTEDNYTQAT